MKRLLAVILLAAGLWSGYWFVAKSAVQGGLTGWFDDRRAEGWQADYSDLRVVGFPNRIDTVLDDLALADPYSGWAWQAPKFQLSALSYRPNHVIAIWPDAQLLATPLGKYRVNSADMRASARVSGTALTLEKVLLSADKVSINHEIDSKNAAALTLTKLNAGLERLNETASYRVAFNADGVTPAAEFRKRIDPTGRLPQSLNALAMDMQVTFDRAWDRKSLERARPEYRRIEVKLAEATWGDLSLAAAGAVDVDAAGMVTGRITIKARNWRDILSASVNAGAIPAAMAQQIERALGLVAQLSGNPKTLDIPLDFKGGLMLLGPVPLAQVRIDHLR